MCVLALSTQPYNFLCPCNARFVVVISVIRDDLSFPMDQASRVCHYYWTTSFEGQDFML